MLDSDVAINMPINTNSAISARSQIFNLCNVETTPMLDVQTMLKQRCTTLIQRCINVVST